MPVAISSPPRSPAPGPRSMIQSEFFITSRLCSIRTTVLPLSTSRWSTRRRAAQSSKDRPVVGLVQQVEGLASGAAGKLGGKLHPLGLAAGQGGGGLSPSGCSLDPRRAGVSSLGRMRGKFSNSSSA